LKKLQALFISVLLLLISFSVYAVSHKSNFPSLPVWIIMPYNNDFVGHPLVLYVELDANSIYCDENNCPAEDTKVLGEGYNVNNVYEGLYFTILKKGALNRKGSWTFNRPNLPIKRGNNFWLWEL
jgi:hypothetical protein